MTIYLVNVALTAILSSFIHREYDEKGIQTYQSKRTKNICLFLIFVLWILIYAFRGVTGADSAVYRGQYKSLFTGKITVAESGATLRSTLFAFILNECAALSGGSWIFFCFVSGILVYFPIFLLISKKSEDINFSFLIYIFTLSFYFGFNGIRQAIAGSFAICAYYFGLREKKLIKYGLLMIIAYGFHSGTLLVLPFQLLSLKKLKSISTWAILIPFAAASLILKDIWTQVIGVFNGFEVVTRYQDVFLEANGSGVIRFIVWIVPVVLVLIYYDRIKSKYQDIDGDTLMVICGSIFMLYSMLDSNFSQLSMFFIDANLILYPKIYNSIKEKSKRAFKYSVLFVYFAYMLVLLLNGDGFYNPYISVWESGMY